MQRQLSRCGSHDGKANFLEKSTQLDIVVVIHQCTRFLADPKQYHVDALRYLGRYLQGTKDKGIFLDPKGDNSFECWFNADFLGRYKKNTLDMHLNKMTAKSRTGSIPTYGDAQ
jgi:hypothetical protein